MSVHYHYQSEWIMAAYRIEMRYQSRGLKLYIMKPIVWQSSNLSCIYTITIPIITLQSKIQSGHFQFPFYLLLSQIRKLCIHRKLNLSQTQYYANYMLYSGLYLSLPHKLRLWPCPYRQFLQLAMRPPRPPPQLHPICTGHLWQPVHVVYPQKGGPM